MDSWLQRCGLPPRVQDTLIACTEMKDNATHLFQLGDFMQMCLQYIEGGWKWGGGGFGWVCLQSWPGMGLQYVEGVGRRGADVLAAH